MKVVMMVVVLISGLTSVDICGDISSGRGSSGKECGGGSSDSDGRGEMAMVVVVTIVKSSHERFAPIMIFYYWLANVTS